jgi:hypothetical protein
MRAYAELAADLERFRRLPYGELARHVGGPPVVRTVETEAGPLKVEVTFGWTGTRKDGGPRLRDGVRPELVATGSA